jgi:septal ring factor EnvC (AmiA/AmiB activator)
MASGDCSWRAAWFGLVLLLVALVSAACATTGVQRSTNIADTMAKQTQVIQEAKPQVDAMLASLEELTRAQGDMRPTFKKFSDTLDDTEKVAARTRKTGQTIREKEAEYFAEWQKQSTEITNPQIRAATQARQTEVKTKLSSLSQTGKAAGDLYDPFISNMKDIRTYLSNDLTTSGVKKIEPTIEKARRDGAALQKALDDFNRASADVQASLRPTGQ